MALPFLLIGNFLRNERGQRHRGSDEGDSYGGEGSAESSGSSRHVRLPRHAAASSHAIVNHLARDSPSSTDQYSSSEKEKWRAFDDRGEEGREGSGQKKEEEPTRPSSPRLPRPSKPRPPPLRSLAGGDRANGKSEKDLLPRTLTWDPNLGSTSPPSNSNSGPSDTSTTTAQDDPSLTQYVPFFSALILPCSPL